MVSFRPVLILAILASSVLLSTAASLAHLNFADVASKYVKSEDFYIPTPDNSTIKLFVRNKKISPLNSFTPANVVLMVHGASYPAETAYDLQLDGFSWMDFLAAHGYDVWCMDVRGYGLSTRPAQMDVDPAANGPIVRTSDAAADVKTVADWIMQRRGVAQHVAIGWSWGTSIMSTYTSLNPSKVSKLVIYAPQWFRAANTAPTTAYRTITRQAAYDRWVRDVNPAEIPALLPGNTFDLWWNATVATDPKANTYNPPAVRAPNGIQLDNSAFWGMGMAPYNISLIQSPVLVIRGDWDTDLPLGMAQGYYDALRVPYKRFVQVSQGTHTLLLEKNRMELFQEVQLFLDQTPNDVVSTPFRTAFPTETAASTMLPASNIVSNEYNISSSVSGINLFVRNKRQSSTTSFSADKTVILVHGATYPASTAFDLQLDGISWLDYLATHGYDAWLLDVRGYGFSTRPAEMEVDPALNGPIVSTADAADDIKSVADFVMNLRGITQHVAIGWSWGTSTMTRYTTLNPTKVKKLVIYAPQWFRAPNPAPTSAYRTANRAFAYSRWISGLTPEQVTSLLPGNTFDIWWNATVKTDPTAFARDPPSIRAPNGIQLDNSRFWGNETAPYNINTIQCPVLVVRGDLDTDLNLNMSQSYYAALPVALKKFAQISMGTHTILLERNRPELFRQVQLFLDQVAPNTYSSPFQSLPRTVASVAVTTPTVSPSATQNSAASSFLVELVTILAAATLLLLLV